MTSPLEYIFDHAPGRWDDIVSNFTNSFDDALAKQGKHVTCPFCGASGKSGFRLKRGFAEHGRSYCSCKNRSGLYLLTELEGTFKDHREGIFEVAKYLGWESGRARKPIKRNVGPTPAEREAARIAKLNTPAKVNGRLDKLRTTWFETTNLQHPNSHLARKYLRSRGLVLVKSMETPFVRFHNGLPYYDEDGKFVGTFPAILFLVKGVELQHPQAIHKIYLSPTGEKLETMNLDWTSKKSSGYIVKEYCEGLSIPLFEKEGCETLNLAEGQETAWAVALITGETTHSCIDAGKLASMIVEKRFKKVRIWADKDVSMTGQIKATELANRLIGEGFIVEIMLPKMAIPEGWKGIDWLDIWASIPFERIKGLTASKRMDGFYSMSCPLGLTLMTDKTALKTLKEAL
jgi:putative DNA primase/helicase